VLEWARADGIGADRAEAQLGRTWAVSFGEQQRVELERIIVDEDAAAALSFLRGVIYPQVKESEKPGSCFHDTSKPVERLDRPVDRHKKLGSF
jgi:hypothetical protein